MLRRANLAWGFFTAVPVVGNPSSILGLYSMLRTSCKQNTLSCNGRTDKLCVERDTMDDTRGPIGAGYSQTFYMLALTVRLTCLLLARLLRVRRDRMIKRHLMVLVFVPAPDVGGALEASGTLGRRDFSGCACCWLVEFFP